MVWIEADIDLSVDDITNGMPFLDDEELKQVALFAVKLAGSAVRLELIEELSHGAF